jgi:hypothetical protein
MNLKKLTKRVGRRIRRAFGHVDDKAVTQFSPVSPLPDFVRDIAVSSPPPPLTIPASPRSGSSSEAFSVPEHPLGAGSTTSSVLDQSASTSSSALHSSYFSAEDTAASLTTKEVASLTSDLPIAEVDIPLRSPLSTPTSPGEDPGMEMIEEPSSPPAPSNELPHGENVGDLPFVSSPPPQHVEPDPDSFLIDDPEDPVSDDENTMSLHSSRGPQGSHSDQFNTSAEDISLAQSKTDDYLSPLSSANLNKVVPPTPPPESDEEEEKTPELYLPGLIIPTMFLPIPNVRRSFSFHLTWWLSRSLMYYSRTTRLIH